MLLEVIQGIQDENIRLSIWLQAAYRARYARRTEKLTAEQMGQLVLAFGGSQSQAEQANPATPVGPKADNTALDDNDKAEGREDQEAEKKPKEKRVKRKPRKRP